MSHQIRGSQQRSLTLTEELERLEQSITLTLQEIDHNFSRAHRIVTSSILPIVEQYANHSRDVWEGSKFWKQFFEASANVSLSGYEEQQSVQDEQEQTATEESAATTHTTLETSESYETPNAQHISTDSIQDLDLSNLTISPSHSTPRPLKQKQGGEEPLPYRSLQQDVDDTTNVNVTYASGAGDPRTPSKQTSSLLDDVAMTPEQSPEVQRRERLPQPGTTQKRSDPLLHSVLDKKYRVQATPLASHRVGGRPARTPGTVQGKKTSDATLESSPLAPPELHAEVFDSPMRREITQNLKQQRTPGVSVLTPAKERHTQAQRTMDVWDSDDDDDMDEATGMPYGASPPKTMQFHVPQSRLLKTPARAASKQIVDNILASAGVGREEDNSEDFDIDLDLSYDDNDMDQTSPSVVRKAAVEDETF
ncbi:DASH complex subunit ask1 [Exophiala xenobiotica]|uniref:DASH complex subunit ASK1 n=1 Tax=Lithohypha guttulata TaxID=1690604 RepID=A0ABR0KP11_9EURO|nr:DASH complex subunit ask1 [Lithohypha guttulata]KAK5330761.1 DASH complex subunit ask1 [Exophiala xenobiotica]